MGEWKRFVVLLSGICLILAAAAEGTAAEKLLKVGLIGPYTGLNSRTGLETKSGMTKAFEDIGYKIGDYKVELVLIDSQSDPAKATSAYAEAVERRGVQATIGNWHSSVAAALMELAADYGVPHMGALGAAEITTDKYKDDLDKYRGYWMKGWATPRKLTVGYADCIEDAVQRGLWKPANKKMAIYGEDADWGRDVGAAFRRTFTALGWEVVSEDYSALGQTEFYPLVSKFKASDVSLVAGSMGHPPMVSAFLKQAHEVRLNAVIISDGLGWVGEWYKLTGTASDHVIDMNPRWATEAAKKFAAEMKEQYGYDPGPASTGIPYDCANHFIKVCKRALEKYGKLDKESIHKVIFDEVCTGNLNYTAEEGALIVKGYRYSLDTYNDPVVARDAFYFPVLQYMKGKSYIVYPEDWKETDLAVRQ